MGQIITIADLQAEGFTDSRFSGDRLTLLIDQAERAIRVLTGRAFYKVDDHTEVVSGRGTAVLKLRDPVLAITSITCSDGSTVDFDYVAKIESLDPESYLRLPRLRLTDSSVWTKGTANYSVSGSFGYVLQEGAEYKAPSLIKRAAILIVAKWAEKLVERVGENNRYPIKSERKGDYSYTLADNAIAEGLIGDPDVDTILMGYRRRDMVAA